jgi:protein phosphatase 2C
MEERRGEGGEKDEESEVECACALVWAPARLPALIGLSLAHGAPITYAGDHYLRPFIISEPEVCCIERLPEDEVLIIATDGLWDVFSITVS